MATSALEHDSQFLTRRSLVLFAIIALHVFIFWALATGLARKAIEVLAPPIQTDIVQEEVKKDQPPPPPPPEFQKPPVEVPPPEVTIDMPVETQQTTAITNVTTRHVEAAAPAPKAVNRVAPKIDVKHFPNSEDYYPAASKRMGEEGSPTVKVCMGADGKLSGPPTIAASSGSARLDAGAIDLAKAGARYISPGTEDGKPVASCLEFRVKFQMTK
jgi:periplasmic protein TonB